jgi:hypothetical protein
MSAQLVEQLDLNDLLYVQGTDASVAENRSLRKFYPEKNIFQNDEKILFRIHGRQFIDSKNSSLRFKIVFTTTGNVKAGEGLYSGSIYNIFSRCRVISSTGKCISDLHNLNLWNRMSQRIYRGGLHNSIVAPIYGVNDRAAAGSEDEWKTNTEYEFIIPLRFLSPFLDCPQLVPPQIAENLQIELFLENTIRCGKTLAAGTISKYEVINPELILDTYLVTPAIDSAVMSMSNQKMVYEFYDWVQVEGNASVNSGEINLALTYPLSNCLECFTTIRKVSIVNDKNKDSFSTKKIGLRANQISQDDQFVMRVGQLQLPQQRCIGGPEIYNMLVNGRKQLESNVNIDFDLPRVRFEEFGGEEDTPWSCYFANLCRSNLFENSGREVSNQQALVAQIKQAVPGNDMLNLFAKYVARVVIENNHLRVET